MLLRRASGMSRLESAEGCNIAQRSFFSCVTQELHCVELDTQCESLRNIELLSSLPTEQTQKEPLPVNKVWARHCKFILPKSRERCAPH